MKKICSFLDIPQNKLKVVINKILSLYPDGFLIFLEGEVGTGKTALAKNLVQCLDSQAITNSPSFDIIEKVKIHKDFLYHIDCYRLKNINKNDEMMLRDSLDVKYVIIEWPSNAPFLFQYPHLNIQIQVNHPNTRNYILSTNDPNFFMNSVTYAKV